MYEVTCFDLNGEVVTSFNQWDTNQVIVIENDNSFFQSAPMFHFCNQKSTVAFGVQSVLKDGKITADVPNILLREPYAITVYIYLYSGTNTQSESSGKTVKIIQLPVRPRPKPTDFAYTDNVQVVFIEDLLDKSNEIYKNVLTVNEDINETKKEIAALSESIGQKSEEATTAAANAKQSEINAKASETIASASADCASTFADRAAESARLTGISETNAHISEINAKDSEAAAKLSEIHASTAEQNTKASEAAAALSEANAENAAEAASASASTAIEKADASAHSAADARASAESVEAYNQLAKSYAVGGTGKRENEDINNAKYYYEQTNQIAAGLGGAILPMGTILFAQLISQTKSAGYMYNISDEFVSDETFKDGGGIHYAAGTNVYYTADGYWDCFAGTGVIVDEELSSTSTNAVQNNAVKSALDKKADLDESGKIPAEQLPVTEIVVDNKLSETSENPVQNKVITEIIGNIESILDDIIGIKDGNEEDY